MEKAMNICWIYDEHMMNTVYDAYNDEYMMNTVYDAYNDEYIMNVWWIYD